MNLNLGTILMLVGGVVLVAAGVGADLDSVNELLVGLGLGVGGFALDHADHHG